MSIGFSAAIDLRTENASGTASPEGEAIRTHLEQALDYFTSATSNLFFKHASQWKKDSFFVSSPSRIAKHPAYQAIIRIGKPSVPLILSELEKEPNHWFIALREIAGEDPISPSERGDMRKMTKAWLRWGKEHGYRRE